MQPIFSKTRPPLQYTHLGIQYAHILFLPLLIFLYCSASFRELLVRVEVPDGVSSATILTHGQIRMDNYPWIYVGEPLDPIKCFPRSKFQIQVDDAFINYESIPLYLSSFQNIDTQVNKTVFLKIDKNTTMDVVFTIREKLSESGFHRICYVVN